MPDTTLNDPSLALEAALFRLVLETADTPVCIFDENLTFLGGNRRFERITGFDDAELKGKPLVGSFLRAECREGLLRELGRIRQGASPSTLDLPIISRDQETLAIQFQVFAARIPQCDRNVFICVGQSPSAVTARVVRDQYAEHAAHLMWRANGNGSFVDCNQAVLDYSGLALEELSGRGWSRLVHPDELDAARETWKQSITKAERFESRHRLCRHDGEYRWHLCRMYPGPAEPGQERIWFGAGIDVHEEQLATVDLREREQWLRTLFQAMHDGLTVRDRTGKIALVNQASQRIMGLTADQLSGLAPSDPRWGAFRPDGTRIDLNELPSVRAVKTGKSQFDYLMGIRHPDGRETWVNVNSVPVLEADGAVSWVVATYADVTDHVIQRNIIEEQKRSLEEANARLHTLASQDGLTGLLNHRSLHERLNEAFSHARRYKRDLSLILLDVDRFKRYNDAHGHLAGDEVLRRVAKTLRDEARISDVVGRYGGEEFLIILPETDFRTAIAAAERFRIAVTGTPYEFGAVTASFGVSTLTEDHSGPGQLLDNADRAMYAAKLAGRNRVMPPASTTSD